MKNWSSLKRRALVLRKKKKPTNCASDKKHDYLMFVKNSPHAEKKNMQVEYKPMTLEETLLKKKQKKTTEKKLNIFTHLGKYKLI